MARRELTLPGGDALDALPQGGALSMRQSELSRRRLGQLGALVPALQMFDSVTWTLSRSLHQNPVMLRDLVVMNVAAAALDLSLYAMARDKRFSDEAVIRWWFPQHVLRCMLLAISPMHFGEMLGLTPPTMTYVCPAVVAFRVLVPLPRIAHVVTLLAAATQPLAITLVPSALPPPWVLAGSIVTATVAAAFALLCGGVTYGLTATAARSQKLGAYRLLARIGEGEYGEVWRAKHHLLARPAAIKTILPAQLSSKASGALLAFEHEAQITASLSSPHTVTVYDYGVSDQGVVYYAMELLDGTDYESFVRENGPVPPPGVVRVGLEVCDSLAEAHARGLMHRDLKAVNLFRAHVGLREDFTVVLDFGLAALQGRSKAHSSRRGSSPHAFSTIAYLPPELLDGGPYDTRADLYQLGCVMYFLLTGRLFESRSSDAATREGLRGLHPSLRDACPFPLPRELEDIVQTCLARDPEDRFRNVEQLEDALHALAELYSLDDLPERGPLRSRAQVARAPAEDSAEPHAQQRLTTQRLSGGSPTRLSRRVLSVWSLEPSGELVNAARRRLGHVGQLAAGLIALLSPVWFFMQPSAVRERVWPELAVSMGCLLSLTLVLVLVATGKSFSVRTALRVGIGYFLLATYLLAAMNARMSELTGQELQRMGLPILTVIVLPVFVPLGLRRLVVPILLAGAAQPLAQLLFGSPDSVALVLRDSVSNAVTSTIAALVIAYLVTQQSARTFGSYTLSEKIGSGAMGEVWKARHESLARPAAIKLLPQDVVRGGSQKAFARFEREAQLTASLTSPHTVTLYDYGLSTEGELYYVMEYLRGRDLQRAVRADGPFTAEEAARTLVPICDSLAEAHARGLVHRDLKPENVFCAHVGRNPDFIKVLDFGLARRDQPADSLLSAQVMWLGTPAYMAPEAFISGASNAQSDLYSLGCILFYLLTGHPPYERPSAVALALAHTDASIPHVSDHTDQPVPAALDDIVTRCLAKDPSQRFQSALDLRAALRAFLDVDQPYVEPSFSQQAPATH